MNILSIDAWANDGGWDWNQWWKIGEISKEEFESLDTNRKILRWFRKEYLNESSKGLCGVEDDQYNIVITDRKNGRPLYAIEYGSEY